MKTNPLTGFLVVVTVACAVWTAWIILVFVSSNARVKNLSMQYAYMENLRVTVQSLANEALQYSKQHPAIDPVLRTFDIKSTNAPIVNVPPAPAKTK